MVLKANNFKTIKLKRKKEEMNNELSVDGDEYYDGVMENNDNMSLQEKQYISESVLPLLSVLDQLSRASLNLSTSVSVLTNSPITPRKKGKIKDTIHTIYDINDQCEDIYKTIKYRIDSLLKYE